MALPVKLLPHDQIEINGEMVEYRSLSRKEALMLGTDFVGNPDAAEIFLLSRGCDISEEEATSWREVTDTKTAGLLLDAIVNITGLGPDSK